VTTIGLLHPGRMGAAVGAQLAASGHRVVWCSDGRSEATRLRADGAGLEDVGDLDSLLTTADTVLVICPSAAASAIAADVSGRGYDGVYVDANAISPQRMLDIAATATAAGATVVDGSIFGAPPNDQRSVRLYLAGDNAMQVAALFGNSQVAPIVLDQPLGSASALKMAFASFQRGSRALAALAHAMADEHGLSDLLVAEAQRMDSAILADRDYLPSVAARAWRWEPELGEVAATQRASDLPDGLAVATGALFGQLAPLKDEWSVSLGEMLARLHVASAERPGEDPQRSPTATEGSP